MKKTKTINLKKTNKKIRACWIKYCEIKKYKYIIN